MNNSYVGKVSSLFLLVITGIFQPRAQIAIEIDDTPLGYSAIRIADAGAFGIVVENAELNGIGVANAGFNGIVVENAGMNGIAVENAAMNGILVENAAGNSLDIRGNQSGGVDPNDFTAYIYNNGSALTNSSCFEA